MRIIVAAFLMASTVAPACAQMTDDPFPSPIASTEDIIRVSFTEFASIPDIEGEAARVMILVDEPGTRRMFVNDMRGPLYTVSYDGRTVREYIDIDDPRWAVAVEAGRREVGFQSFALHPQFGEPGTGGYGRFYTWTDTANLDPTPDFVDRHEEYRVDARLQTERWRRHARHHPTRMDRPKPRCRHLRWGSAARVAQDRTALSQPQRRAGGL